MYKEELTLNGWYANISTNLQLKNKFALQSWTGTIYNLQLKNKFALQLYSFFSYSD